MSTAATTRTVSVYDRLRADLLSGRIPPGTRLKLVALAAEHSVSMSVIREALSRLSAEGLVVATPPGNGVPASAGEYSWGGAASTTFWVDPASQLTVVFMAQLQPPVGDIPRDRLHAVVYRSIKDQTV